MPSQTHLFDLVELPPHQRRLIQLLLRSGALLESNLLQAGQLLPGGADLSVRSIHDELQALTATGWLFRDETGDEPSYRVRFARRPQRLSDAMWMRLRDNRTGQSRVNEGFSDAEFPRRRGGKRALPQAIWDKLETEPASERVETAAPSSAQRRLRKTLWEALDDDSK